jgi:hypothetical protein
MGDDQQFGISAPFTNHELRGPCHCREVELPLQSGGGQKQKPMDRGRSGDIAALHDRGVARRSDAG